MDHPAPGPLPWTMRVGLALLWLAQLAVAALMAMMALFVVATRGLEGAQPSPIQLAIGVLVVLCSLGMLTVLVFATLRKPWARWVAAVAGIVVGGLALFAILFTRSAAPETVAVALAALVGGVLLALPASRPHRAPRRRLPPWGT